MVDGYRSAGGDRPWGSVEVLTVRQHSLTSDEESGGQVLEHCRAVAVGTQTRRAACVCRHPLAQSQSHQDGLLLMSSVVAAAAAAASQEGGSRQHHGGYL